MVQYYNILGARVGSQHLAMGCLALYAGGGYLLMKPSGNKTTAAPPINASSPDEADFIKKFMEQAEAGDKSKAKH